MEGLPSKAIRGASQTTLWRDVKAATEETRLATKGNRIRQKSRGTGVRQKDCPQMLNAGMLWLALSDDRAWRPTEPGGGYQAGRSSDAPDRTRTGDPGRE